MDYFKKMRGSTKSPPMVGLSEIIWSWIGAFTGIAAVAFLHYTILAETDLVMIIGSFGAWQYSSTALSKAPWHSRGTSSAVTCYQP